MVAGGEAGLHGIAGGGGLRTAVAIDEQGALEPGKGAEHPHSPTSLLATKETGAQALRTGMSSQELWLAAIRQPPSRIGRPRISIRTPSSRQTPRWKW